MEGPFRLLVVVGLLAALLPAAAATFGPQPETPCEPTLLATQVALFCAPGMPTAQCCEPVVAAVDLGGGVPCLCRVAAEPQLAMAGLNATHLLTLYTSCGGLRPGGAHLAAACERTVPRAPADDRSPPPSPAPRGKNLLPEATSFEKLSPSKTMLVTPRQLPTYAKSLQPNLSIQLSKVDDNPESLPCDYQRLASDIGNSCGTNIPNSTCCMAVVATVDIGGCFCKVIHEEAIVTGSFGGRHILFLYNACGGLRPLSYQELADCDTSGSTPQAGNESTAVKCNNSSDHFDITNASNVNTVLLSAILFVVIAQALFFLCIWLKAKLLQAPRGISGGGLPVHQLELLQRTTERTTGRLTQSDGGVGSFHQLHHLLPSYARRNRRMD